MSGREHFVSAGGCRSRTVKISTEVPQGSVLGPLLFSIFTTPVGTLISTFGIPYHQFADDTQLYTAIKSLLPVDLATLSDCVDALMGWHIANNLLLNPSKTKAIHRHSPANRKTLPNRRHRGLRVDCTIRRKAARSWSDTQQLPVARRSRHGCSSRLQLPSACTTTHTLIDHT